MPFEIKLGDEVPNEATRRAMVEAEAKAMGLIEDTSPRFKDVDALMSHLEEPEDV